MQATPTVMIDTGEGYPVKINESDFDPKKHTLFGEEKPKKQGGRGRKKPAAAVEAENKG